jgi:putative transposase
MPNKAYKVRLYPNKSQATLIDKTIGATRFMYNQMLAERIVVYNQFRINEFDSNEEIDFKKSELKSHTYKSEKNYKEQEELNWLKDVSSRALQQSRIDLESAYKNFYRSIKNGKPAFPKFKSKHKSRKSYREPQVGNSIAINENGTKIKLLKIGHCKFRGLAKEFQTKQLLGDVKILSATISKDPDSKYYCSILVETESIYVISTTKGSVNEPKQRIGLDLGLTDFVITSNGDYFTPIKKELNLRDKQIRKLQKKLSRQTLQAKKYQKTSSKVTNKSKEVKESKETIESNKTKEIRFKSSNRREKIKTKIAILHKKQTNTKAHYHWHLANKLTNENQAISLETLKVKNMVKNKKLARAIAQASWSSFIIKLAQKAKQKETRLHFQPTFFASTKTCYKCNKKNLSVQLSDRILTCPNPDCNFKIQRDLQASLNLEKQLSLEYSDYRHRESVRPKQINFDLSGKFVEVSTNEIVYV